MGVMSSVARYLFSYGEGLLSNFVRIVTTVSSPDVTSRVIFGVINIHCLSATGPLPRRFHYSHYVIMNRDQIMNKTIGTDAGGKWEATFQIGVAIQVATYDSER